MTNKVEALEPQPVRETDDVLGIGDRLSRPSWVPAQKAIAKMTRAVPAKVGRDGLLSRLMQTRKYLIEGPGRVRPSM